MHKAARLATICFSSSSGTSSLFTQVSHAQQVCDDNDSVNLCRKFALFKILLPLRLFQDLVETVVSFVVAVSPFTLQAHHSLHCIHGSQMDMPLETLLGPE